MEESNRRESKRLASLSGSPERIGYPEYPYNETLVVRRAFLFPLRTNIQIHYGYDVMPGGNLDCPTRYIASRYRQPHHRLDVLARRGYSLHSQANRKLLRHSYFPRRSN